MGILGLLRLSVLELLLLVSTPGAGSAGLETLTLADIRSFDAAVASAAPGDTLTLADGVWRDAVLRFRGAGAMGLPIVLRAETPGRVILTGTSRVVITGEYLEVNGLWFKDGALEEGHVVEFLDESTKHCRLTQTAVTDYNPPDPKQRYSWISLAGTHNRVDHCYLRGKTHRSVDVGVSVRDVPTEHRIDHNLFAGRPPLGRNGGETIRVGNSWSSMTTSRTLVERNWFENCDGEDEIISSKSCENTYQGNVFWGSSGALVLRHGNRCVVTDNWFLGKGKQGSGGVRVIGEDHVVTGNYFEGLEGSGFRAALMVMNGIPDSKLNGYWQVKRALVADNIFVDCASTIEINLGAGTRNRTLIPLASRIEKNVLSNERDTLVTVHEDASGITWERNLFHGSAGIDIGGSNVLGDPGLKRAVDGSLRAERLPEAGRGVPMLHRSETGPEWIALIEAARAD
jgi:poly(beta-D-mannuronate) lyase